MDWLRSLHRSFYPCSGIQVGDDKLGVYADLDLIANRDALCDLWMHNRKLAAWKQEYRMRWDSATVDKGTECEKRPLNRLCRPGFS